MKVSREQMVENRQRILDVAAALFREKGFDAVGVAEIMRAAGFTHGGFYGHFESKDDLIVQALGHAIDVRKRAVSDFDAFIDDYLSPRHRDDASGGCPIAGLAAEALRQTQEARSAVTDGIRAQIGWMSKELAGPGERDRRRAIATTAAMVGATILARVTIDPALSDEILKETRAWLDSARDRPAARSQKKRAKT